MKPILIAGALQSEIDFLISKLENSKKSKLSTYDFYEGKINGYPICLIKTEVGLVNAASSLSLAIEKCRPAFIINEGTAGGITPKHHKKDIIIGKEILNIMSCRTPYKELGEGSNSLEWEYISFLDGEIDRRVVYCGNEEIMEFIYALRKNYQNGKVYKGVIGSGDVWNREKDKLKFLNEKFKVDCEDMESVAIYTVAKNFDIPVISVKIMSDNELLGEEYEPEVASKLQEFIYTVLLEMSDNLKD